MTTTAIDLALLRAWPGNPRKTFEQIDELAESITTVGLLQPLVVRKAKKPAGQYEVICGERRRRALLSIDANWKEVPCTVVEMNDDDATAAALVENSQRADVPLLEEAEALAQMHDVLELSIEEIAARTGKTPRYLSSRMRVARLPDAAKKALTEGYLLPGAAMLIAQVEDQEERADIVKTLLDGIEHDVNDPIDARDARLEIERAHRLIARAPFNTLIELAGAPACIACPKRSGGQVDLFGSGGSDACLDGACWTKKVAVHAEAILERAESRGLKVLKDAEAKKQKVIEYQRLAYNFVDLDSTANRAPDFDVKWRDLLGDKAPEPTIVVVEGLPREVIPRKAAVALLAGKTPPKDTATEEASEPTPEEKKAAAAAKRAKDKEKLERAWMQELRDACVKEPESEVTEAVGAMLVELALAATSGDVVKLVAKQLSLDVTKTSPAAAIRAHVAAQVALRETSLEHSICLVVALLFPTSPYQLDEAKAFAKSIGVDVDAAKERAKAAVKGGH